MGAHKHQHHKHHPHDDSPHEKKDSCCQGKAKCHSSDETLNQAQADVEHNEAQQTIPQPKREPKNVMITDIELEKMHHELAELKDKYLHALAESENSRKRLQKEKQEMIQYAIQNIIIDFLNPIDHMENALSYTQQMSEEVKHWAIGFQMILTQFKDVLTNNGVTPFVSEGKPFDPHLHEAIEAVESNEIAPNTVIKENLKGYKMNDKAVIRPARVIVSKAPANKNENKDIEQSK